jgi:hypothetical protein
MKTLPGEHGFEEEREALFVATRTVAGRRKLVLPMSKKRSLTVGEMLWKAMDNARYRATKTGAIFTLTDADLCEHMERVGGKCELSGIHFNPQFDPSAKFAHNPYGISIDRIRPSEGYVPGNVRLLLTSLNFAINQWGLETYLDVAKAVLTFSTKGEDQ